MTCAVQPHYEGLLQWNIEVLKQIGTCDTNINKFVPACEGDIIIDDKKLLVLYCYKNNLGRKSNRYLLR